MVKTTPERSPLRSERRSGVLPLLSWSAVLGMLALVTACVPSETEIQSGVKEKLATSPTTSKLDLDVAVEGRVVHIAGRTSSQEEQLEAIQLARSVRGVKLVVNDMWLNDVALADKVKAALASDPLLASVPMEVDARDGLVRLMSDQTNREQRERAVQVASAVEGVRQVENRMR